MNILLLQGTGNGEADMARICSRFGRVVLVQQGRNTHVEIWEKGGRIYNSPLRHIKFLKFNDALFGPFSSLRALRGALRHRNGKHYDVVVATAYDYGNVALLLRQLGLVKRFIALGCDYLPLEGVSFAVRCHRRITGFLTANNFRRADSVWLVSPRLPTPGRTDAVVMPLFIADFKPSPKRKKAIAYVGHPTPDHGLDTLFDISARHGIEIHVVGNSPYLESLLARKKTDLIHWHGLVTDRARLHELIKDCYCGYAVYKNVIPGSFLYYGVWSKIYTCLASRLPVVTTPGSYTSEIIQQHGVGKVVQPEPAAIEQGVLELWNEHEKYEAVLERFIVKWNQGVEDFMASQIPV